MRILFSLLTLVLISGCFAPTGDVLHYYGKDRIRIKQFKLATAKDPEAKFKLGMSYCCEEQDRRDYTVATRWFCRAATEQRHAPSAKLLGDMYSSNKPETLTNSALPANDILAYSWYSIASKWGDTDAMTKQLDLKERMTRPQLQAAKVYIANFPDMPCIIDEY